MVLKRGYKIAVMVVVSFLIIIGSYCSYGRFLSNQLWGEIYKNHVMAAMDPHDGRENYVLTDIRGWCEENAKVVYMDAGTGCWVLSGNEIIFKYNHYFEKFPSSYGIVNPNFRNTRGVMHPDFERRYLQVHDWYSFKKTTPATYTTQ